MRFLGQIWPQPLVGALVMTIAIFGVSGAWAWHPLLTTGSGVDAWQAIVALYLMASVVAAYQFPIHAGHGHKVEMTTVPIYLMVVLLPSVPVAATAAGLAVLAAELLVRNRRGNYYSDVLSAAGRWTIVALVAASVARMPIQDDASRLALVALVMWVSEVLTTPLVLGPITGRPPFRVITGVLSRATPSEWAQYGVGLIAALAAGIHGLSLVLMLVPIVLVYLAFKNVMELRSSTRQMLESMADEVDMRDPYTGGHSRRVAELTQAVLHEMQMWGPSVEIIVSAARVHDIGKMGLPDYILNKPGPLTPEEWAIMKSHAERGADLLKRYRGFADGVESVRHHHERWDGQGYPARLKGKSIPFGARIIAVADSFDAMTSERPYRAAMTVHQAMKELREGRGTQWDPAVVDAFLSMMSKRLEQQQASNPLSRAPLAASTKLA